MYIVCVLSFLSYNIPGFIMTSMLLSSSSKVVNSTAVAAHKWNTGNKPKQQFLIKL